MSPSTRSISLPAECEQSISATLIALPIDHHDDVRVPRTVTRRIVVSLFASAFTAFIAAPAAAQLYTERSYILPQGSVELTGTPARPIMVDMNISDDEPAFDPFTTPVHVYFGVTGDLTLGVTHDRGPCFNCGDDFYNTAGLGLGLLYGLVQKPTFELDFHATAPLIPRFDPFNLSVRAGVLGRVNISPLVAFVFDPALQVGLIGRPDEDGANRDFLFLPVWFYFQATDVVVPFVGTAMEGRVEGFGDNFQIPLEGGVIASVNRNIDLGGVFRFRNLMGRGGSADWRTLGFIGRFRFN
jgi:hypothetical protein